LPNEKSIKRNALCAPYTPKEVALIDRDVSGQRNDRLTIAGRAIRTLGLGCGIAGGENTAIRGTDIARRTDGAVTVMTPSGRRVVCLEKYSDDLAELAGLAGSGLLVGPNITRTDKNLASALARGVRIDSGRIKLNASRLRTTWLVTHLNAGTNMKVLVAAAGLQSIQSLRDLLQYMDPVDESSATAALRVV